MNSSIFPPGWAVYAYNGRFCHSNNKNTRTIQSAKFQDDKTNTEDTVEEKDNQKDESEPAEPPPIDDISEIYAKSNAVKGQEKLQDTFDRGMIFPIFRANTEKQVQASRGREKKEKDDKVGTSNWFPVL